MKDAVIYIHGKGGSAEEAEHYQYAFKDYDMIGFDYRAQTPWEAEKEFPAFFDTAAENHRSVTVVANSIGAYFAMQSLDDKRIERAFFISPIMGVITIASDKLF